MNRADARARAAAVADMAQDVIGYPLLPWQFDTLARIFEQEVCDEETGHADNA